MRKVLYAAMAAAVMLPLPAAAAPSARSYSDRLARLPELSRYAALRSVLVGSGQICRRVESAARRGTLRNLAMWAVRCTPTGDYGVFIGPDGSAQVRTCADLAQLRLPTCGLKPRPAAPTRTPAPRPR
ncbi:MAG: hypothetical protein JWL91_1739 [Sphingomonas bacterium]|nr:hypothetical protein [Sphingomonas bacterium]MDB5689863.1 hypothetical protein [Sphingomonas bacterium]